MIDRLKQRKKELLSSLIYIDIYSILLSSLAFSGHTDPPLHMHKQNHIYNRSSYSTAVAKIAVLTTNS